MALIGRFFCKLWLKEWEKGIRWFAELLFQCFKPYTAKFHTKQPLKFRKSRIFFKPKTNLMKTPICLVVSESISGSQLWGPQNEKEKRAPNFTKKFMFWKLSQKSIWILSTPTHLPIQLNFTLQAYSDEEVWEVFLNPFRNIFLE